MKKIDREGVVHYADKHDGEWSSICGASLGKGSPAQHNTDVTCSRCVSMRAKTLVTHRRWQPHPQTFLRDVYGYYVSDCSDNEGDYHVPDYGNNRIDPDEVDDENPTCIACIAMK